MVAINRLLNAPARPHTAPAGGRPTSVAQIEEEVDVGSNMIIAVRVRPMNERETNSPFREVIRVLDRNVLTFDPRMENIPQLGDSTGRNAAQQPKRMPAMGRRERDIQYGFDCIFDATATQEDIFDGTTRFLVDGVLSGYNATVFAYGATGAGKTYTMLGTESSPGVMVLTIRELYTRMEQNPEKNFDIAVSYLEVYNETIRDLLVDASGPLNLREEIGKPAVVGGLSLHKPTNADELYAMLQTGNDRRTQHPTDANAQSSRSHAVFQIYVRQRDRTADISSDYRMAKLSLIDLAGSERATVTTNRGDRLREGANINKSLLALGNCINALVERKGKSSHIPYRDSKLTRLLKDSLGGNCRSVMIANVSPSAMSYEDTHNTLKYANRAKNIQTKVVRNVVNVNSHISKYREIIDSQRAEIAELKERLLKVAPQPQRPITGSASAASSNARGGQNTTKSAWEDDTASARAIEQIYAERLQLRREFAELDRLDKADQLEIARRRRQHALARSAIVDEECAGETIRRLERETAAFSTCLQERDAKRKSLAAQLAANEERMQAIQIPAQLPHAQLGSSGNFTPTYSSPAALRARAAAAECEKAELELRVRHVRSALDDFERSEQRSERVIAALASGMIAQNEALRRAAEETGVDADAIKEALGRFDEIVALVSAPDGPFSAWRLTKDAPISYRRLSIGGSNATVSEEAAVASSAVSVDSNAARDEPDEESHVDAPAPVIHNGHVSAVPTREGPKETVSKPLRSMMRRASNPNSVRESNLSSTITKEKPAASASTSRDCPTSPPNMRTSRVKFSAGEEGGWTSNQQRAAILEKPLTGDAHDVLAARRASCVETSARYMGLTAAAKSRAVSRKAAEDNVAASQTKTVVLTAPKRPATAVVMKENSHPSTGDNVSAGGVGDEAADPERTRALSAKSRPESIFQSQSKVWR